MKTENTIAEPTVIKDFHTVEFFRKIKQQIAKETEGMSFEELKKYFAEKLNGGSNISQSGIRR